MTEERKHAILFSATILAARKLAEIGDRPCPAEALTDEQVEQLVAIRKRLSAGEDTDQPTDAVDISIPGQNVAR